MATEPRIIKFYETTLRDGEQTPGTGASGYGLRYPGLRLSHLLAGRV